MAGPPRISIASSVGRVAVGYALLATLSLGLAVGIRGAAPWSLPEAWLPVVGWVAVAASAGLGLGLTLAVVVATRITVRRFPWAQRLHLDLRPIARDLATGPIVLIAFFSSLGEELLFRGLLQPWLGLLPTAVVFGLCHQVPGPARWVWVCWATFVGLAFGAIFAATGSLVGALLAHAVINALNLAYLRDHDPLVRTG